MDLFALKGNTLKVYLGLVVGCNPYGIYPHTDRTLRQKVRLSRNTVRRALRHLKQEGLIEETADGWWVRTAPLECLPSSPSADETAPKRGSRMDPLYPVGVSEGSIFDPPIRADRSEGSKMAPPAPYAGSKTDPFVREGGQKWTPSAPGLMRARTSRSSSNEEDSSCTAVPPSSLPPSSPPLGEGEGKEGVGGENIPEEKRKRPPSEYLSEMQSWWDAIWPENLEEDHPWFGRLWEEFGLEIPVQVLRQFAEGGRTLTDLEYPECYQRYFLSCCRNASKQRPTLCKPPSSAADYDPDLKVLYVADPGRRGSELDRIEAKIKALCRVDRDDTAYDAYEQTLRAPYRAERSGP